MIEGFPPQKKGFISKGQLPLIPDTLFDSPRETQATTTKQPPA